MKQFSVKKTTRDEQYNLPTLLQYHQTMLSDNLRNKHLYDLLKAKITPETKFLDIGAGTGVWAILAAKLGARKVTAVEIEKPLIPFIFRHAQENGVSDRIEIICGDINNVKIKGKYNLIVSELFGGNGLNDELINSFISIRNRFLARDGEIIPFKISLAAVPARISDSVHSIPAGLPLSCNYLKSLKTNFSQKLTSLERENIVRLAEPKIIQEIDFRSANEPPSTDFTAVWSVENLAEANAVIVYHISGFTDEDYMDSWSSRSWQAIAYMFDPFEKNAGQLHFSFQQQGQQSFWSVHTNSDAVRTYSPSFVTARLKMALEMTPYRNTRRKL